MGDNNLPKWKGEFNWHGEVLTYYKHALSKSGAKALMLKAMAKDVDRPVGVLWGSYNGTKDNYTIKEVTNNGQTN